MAYSEIYERINWENEIVSKSTPIGAVNLNKMDYALKEIDKRVVEMSGNQDSFLTEEEASENYATKSETEKIATEVSKGKADVIHATASGESIHATDSTDNKVVEFALHGKATQKQYSGKSLTPVTLSSGTKQGVTATVSDEGVVTMNGKNSDDTYAVWFPIYGTEGTEFDLPNGKYIASFDNPALPGATMRISYMNEYFYTSLATENLEVEFEVTDEKKLSVIWLTAIKSMSLPNVILHPMIRLASETDNTWEPYVGGTPSPNPDYLQDIEISGESYNLLENTAVSQTTAGIEFTVNEDKSVSVSGGQTASGANALLKINELDADFANGKIFNGITNGSNNIALYAEWRTETDFVGSQYCTNGDVVLSKPSGATILRVSILIKNGITVPSSGMTFYPMIRKASVKSSRYMPYGVGSVEVKSVGSQLFNVNEAQIGVAWNGASNVARAVGVIECKPNTTYTITCDSTIFDGVYYFQKVNKSDTIQNGDGGIIRNALTFTTIENTNFLVIQFNKENVSKTDIENAEVMVNEGTIALPYEPYKESPKNISTPNGLAGIKVSSGGNYVDASGQQWVTDEKVKYADGTGQYIQRVAENSSFNFWSQGQSNYGYIYAFTYNGKNSENTPFLSNCFHFVNNKSSAELNIGEGYVRTGTSTPVISVCSDISTVEEFQNWISNNGVLFYTILAEPIITDLTAEELAELEVQTFYPTTNILNDAGCGMEITYKADTRNYIDKIIGERISAIETALINNI